MADKWKVIRSFTDAKDEGHLYKVGDMYPRYGGSTTVDRIEELISCANIKNTPYIEIDNTTILPDVTIADNGKVLVVIDGKWKAAKVSELPAVTVADNGKILGVVNGKWGIDQRTYNVYFYNGNTLLQTVSGVEYGEDATYTGETPTSGSDIFDGWLPEPTNIHSDTSCYAQFTQAPFDPDTGMILDDWATIVSKIASGTAPYVVGNFKPLDLGAQGIVSMQIVAAGANASPLASGSGNATYDFVAERLLTTTHNMNDTYTNTGGWEGSGMRSYLKNTIKPLIPQVVRDAIKEVTKTSYRYDTSNANATTTDDVWIPSYREIFGGTDRESQGPIYSDIYTDAASRFKTIVGGSASYWWLRSAVNDNNQSFRDVDTTGNASTDTAHYSRGVALGFSL